MASQWWKQYKAHNNTVVIKISLIQMLCFFAIFTVILWNVCQLTHKCMNTHTVHRHCEHSHISIGRLLRTAREACWIARNLSCSRSNYRKYGGGEQQRRKDSDWGCFQLYVTVHYSLFLPQDPPDAESFNWREVTVWCLLWKMHSHFFVIEPLFLWMLKTAQSQYNQHRQNVLTSTISNTQQLPVLVTDGKRVLSVN